MLIQLTETPLIGGRHSGGGGSAADVVVEPHGHGLPTLQFPNGAQRQDQEQEPMVAAAPPGSVEHQLQERLLVIDRRLHQAMYNNSL